MRRATPSEPPFSKQLVMPVSLSECGLKLSGSPAAFSRPNHLADVGPREAGLGGGTRLSHGAEERRVLFGFSAGSLKAPRLVT